MPGPTRQSCWVSPVNTPPNAIVLSLSTPCRSLHTVRPVSTTALSVESSRRAVYGDTRLPATCFATPSTAGAKTHPFCSVHTANTRRHPLVLPAMATTLRTCFEAGMWIS